MTNAEARVGFPWLIVGSVTSVLVLGCAGLVVMANVWFPSNDDIVIANETDTALTDVVLTEGADDADARTVARFVRIGAHDSATAAGAGTGCFSVAYSHLGGRWIARRARWRDDDDISGSEPEVLRITQGKVGGVAVTSVR